MAGLELLSGRVTFSAVKDSDVNYLPRLQWPQRKREFYERIEGHRPLLQALVRHHLGVPATTTVHISPQTYWRHGSFNLVVPINVVSNDPLVPPFAMLRFPLPYRVGETILPGGSDEKLRCEAATYAWLAENCPSVPIPQLYGFGLSTNQKLTHLRHRPWWSQWFHQTRRYLFALLRLPCPSLYISHNSTKLASLGVGYLLIQTISNDEGEMLSETWEDKLDDVRLRNNLNRSLVRILLSVTKIPLPRIGAFRMDDHGYIKLDNRPLHAQFVLDENEGIITDVSRQDTMSSTHQLILRHLDGFENRLIQQPNSCSSERDAWKQMTSLAIARAVFPCMFRHDLAYGPFVFSFTDLHRSNILVDQDWNIVRIIDLEFASAWPLEFQHPPYWLSNQLIDEIDPAGYGPHHRRFVERLEEEERSQAGAQERCQAGGRAQDREPLSSVMRRAWSSGAFWAFAAIQDPIGFATVIWDRILPDQLSFSAEEIDKLDVKTLSRFWRPDLSIDVDRKLRDREQYLTELEDTFKRSQRDADASE